jgi:hypothetical protein
MPFTVEQLTELFKAGPVMVFAAAVWFEVHEMRVSVTEMSASVAVLVDRADAKR